MLLDTKERLGSAGGNFYRQIKELDFTGFDFIEFSDQDDVWQLDKLMRMLGAMQELDLHMAPKPHD